MAGITLPPDATRPATRNGALSGAAPAGARGDARAPAAEGGALGLSTLARRAAALEAALERGPGLDGERVAALRQAIRDGSYEVDSDRLARAIMRLEGGR